MFKSSFLCMFMGTSCSYLLKNYNWASADEDHVMWSKAQQQLLNGPYGEFSQMKKWIDMLGWRPHKPSLRLHFRPLSACHYAAFTSYQIYFKFKQPCWRNCNFPLGFTSPPVMITFSSCSHWTGLSVNMLWPKRRATSNWFPKPIHPGYMTLYFSWVEKYSVIQFFRFFWYDVNMKLSFSLDKTVYGIRLCAWVLVFCLKKLSNKLID